MIEIDKIGSFYADKGYVETKLLNSTAVEKMAIEAKQFMAQELGYEIELKDYHNHIQSEKHHRDYHYRLTQLIRKKEIHKKLVIDNQAIFTNLVGLDLDIQVEPYIRISRPNEASDNIGLHRDTFYGNSPYEISCIVPLSNFTQGAGVSVWPYSQHLGEIEYKQHKHPSIAKGSKQNQIGFLYAPKEILNVNYDELHTPLLKVGECLMFSLGLVHGQEINSSNYTRWSMDFRFKSNKVAVQNNLKSNYYMNILKSPSSSIGDQYLNAISKSAANTHE